MIVPKHQRLLIHGFLKTKHILVGKDAYGIKSWHCINKTLWYTTYVHNAQGKMITHREAFFKNNIEVTFDIYTDEHGSFDYLITHMIIDNYATKYQNTTYAYGTEKIISYVSQK